LKANEPSLLKISIQVVRMARRLNTIKLSISGSRGQRSSSHDEAEVRFGGLAEASFPISRALGSSF